MTSQKRVQLSLFRKKSITDESFFSALLLEASLPLCVPIATVNSANSQALAKQLFRLVSISEQDGYYTKGCSPSICKLIARKVFWILQHKSTIFTKVPKSTTHLTKPHSYTKIKAGISKQPFKIERQLRSLAIPINSSLTKTTYKYPPKHRTI